MINRNRIVFLTLSLTLFTINTVCGQTPTEPFLIRDSNKGKIDIDRFVIKGDHKTYEFKMDTASTDYKTLSGIDPDWIKEVEILRNEQRPEGNMTVVIISLKKGKLKRLPAGMRAKFE